MISFSPAIRSTVFPAKARFSGKPTDPAPEITHSSTKSSLLDQKIQEALNKLRAKGTRAVALKTNDIESSTIGFNRVVEQLSRDPKRVVLSLNLADPALRYVRIQALNLKLAQQLADKVGLGEADLKARWSNDIPSNMAFTNFLSGVIKSHLSDKQLTIIIGNGDQLSDTSHRADFFRMLRHISNQTTLPLKTVQQLVTVSKDVDDLTPTAGTGYNTAAVITVPKVPPLNLRSFAQVTEGILQEKIDTTLNYLQNGNRALLVQAGNRENATLAFNAMVYALKQDPDNVVLSADFADPQFHHLSGDDLQKTFAQQLIKALNLNEADFKHYWNNDDDFSRFRLDRFLEDVIPQHVWPKTLYLMIGNGEHLPNPEIRSHFFRVLRGITNDVISDPLQTLQQTVIVSHSGMDLTPTFGAPFNAARAV